MAWILHVSDAHLGSPSPAQFLDDAKARFLRPGDRLTTQTVLRSTLAGLRSWGEVKKLDAVIFSGDVTNQARKDGFEAFEGLLEELGPLRPPNNQIVVVPGNHDVKWRTLPGSDERYELFKRWVRDKGYVTPLLDGIDLTQDGDLKPDAIEPVLQNSEFIVLAINSSNYCGVIDSDPELGVLWQRALRFARPKVRKRAQAEIHKLEMHDVARISSQQLNGIRSYLERHSLTAANDSRVKIAVLHHHLLPVSTREEVKSFESVTNLGEVRLFLRDLGFQVVVHGHKHESNLFWDHVHDPTDQLESPSSRMLVISAPGQFRPGELTCRAIEVFRRAPHTRGSRPDPPPVAPVLRVHHIAGCRRGEGVSTAPSEIAPLWKAEMEVSPMPFDYVYGRSVDEVYERLQSVGVQLVWGT